MDTTDLDKGVKTEAVNVIIDQCNICCMSDHPRGVNASAAPVEGNPFYSSVVGLSFCQQTYSTNVNIVNVIMTNIASQNSSIVYFEYNSNVTNSVSIHNSRFTNITSKKIPIISVTVTSQHNSNSATLFEINNCSFQHNTATLTGFLKQGAIPSSRVKYKITSTLISENKASQFTKWEVSSGDKSTSVIFDNCLFKSNKGLTLQFKNTKDITITNSIFQNNTLKYVDYLYVTKQP